jgi:O-antigen ligase
MGAVGETSSLVMIMVGLIVAGAALALGAWRGGLALPALPLWPLGGFACLGLAQLVPLPATAQLGLAPGPWAVWHPLAPEAAAILGDTARPVSLDPHTTLRAVALVLGWGLLAAVAAPALARTSSAVRAIGTVALFGFALSAYAILARARFGSLLYGTFPVPTVSPFGPFVNKNHFAGWAAMAALLVAGLALGLAEEARRRRGAAWTSGRGAGLVALTLLAALSLALAVVASLSRGGTFALAVGTGCLLVLVLRGSRRAAPSAWLSSLALAVVLVSAVLWLAPRAAHERLRSLAGASFRTDTWRDCLHLVASSPLVGSGLGAFHDAYPRFKRGNGSVRVEHAENDYLETLAETGILGLAFALFALVSLLRAPTRALEPGPDRVLRAIESGALAALVALAAHSTLDFNLRIPSNGALAALAAALAAAGRGTRQRPLRPGAALALAVALGALGLAVLLQPDRPWLAAREAVRLSATSRTPAARSLRLERAERTLDRVLELRPAHAESWLMLAGVRQARGDPGSAAALARRAVWLDPERAELRTIAAQLTRRGPPDTARQGLRP